MTGLNVGGKSYAKPNSAHSDLERDWCFYLERLARQKYITLKEVPLDQLRRNRNAKRVDVWALRWMDPLWIIIGEIKVSRPDFLSDIRSGKWKEALDACHRFYFITTYGLITEDDLPENAGWMEQRKSKKGFKEYHGLTNEGFKPSDGLWASVVKKLSTYGG